MAVDATQRYIGGGINASEVGFYDGDGLLCGAVTSLAAGEDSPMAEWIGPKTFNTNIPAVTRATQTGGDRVQGTLTFPPTEDATLDITMGVRDQDLHSGLQSTLVWDDGQFRTVAFNPQIDQYPNVMISLHSLAKSVDFGEAQIPGFEVSVFNQCEFAPGGNSRTERQVIDYAYSASCAQTGRFPWGAPVTKANLNTLKTAGAQWFSKYKHTYHCARGAVGLTSVTLAKTPIATHLDATAIQVWSYDIATKVWTKLVATTDYTLVVATRVLTFVNATTGKHLVARYQFVD